MCNNLHLEIKLMVKKTDIKRVRSETVIVIIT